MRYEQPVFRPPSEARSLILQVTVGCSHNGCSFCYMYKGKRFRVRGLDEIREDIAWAGRQYGQAEKIFLADGDALAMETGQLLEVLAELRRTFPHADRISLYAGPKNIIKKTPDELASLHDAGIKLAYMGIESGDEEVLRSVHKGTTPDEMVAAGKKIQEAGIALSATVILGLGGRERWREHALATARAASAINPHYLAALTLMVEEEMPLAKKIARGEFTLLSPRESLEELKLLLEALDVDHCVFRSNHASNYFAVGGILPDDREGMLAAVDRALKNEQLLKPEYFRGF